MRRCGIVESLEGMFGQPVPAKHDRSHPILRAALRTAGAAAIFTVVMMGIKQVVGWREKVEYPGESK